MAYEEGLRTISLPNIVAFGSAQYLFCRLVTGGVSTYTTTSQQPIGVIQDTPITNQVANVAIGGVSKVVAGGTVNWGTLLTVDNAGKVIAWITGMYPVGTSLGAGVSGDIIPVLLNVPSRIPNSVPA